jgi:hypothetical protein
MIVTAAIAAGIGLYIALYLTAAPLSAAAVQTSSGPHLYLATVPAAALSDRHPTWVSYYSVSSNSTHWRHATTYVLPAHTLVHVTVFEYDSQTGLRNPFLAAVTGTANDKMLLNGKPVSAVNPDAASHIFAVPQINLNIPLPGPGDNAKNPCSNAPCSLSNAHETIEFSFRTPGKGIYRFQCFVPCAAGFIDGFGGPMQSIGYMDGFLKIV